jgi:uncharacterized membrane protein YdjX (TVP38/TMEM64 family)
MAKNHKTKQSIAVIIGLAALMIIAAIYFSKVDVEYVKSFLLSFGMLAPIVCIAGMTLAVIIAPMPSLPFDLAAGALFGGFLGGVYSMTGAVIGSIIAFLITRKFGRRVMQKYAADYAKMCEQCDENYIFVLLFVSRLIPLISFDIVSYAAGLTPIKLWKFIVATVVGVVPVTFVLTYSGSLLTYGSTLINIALTVMILFTMFFIPRYLSQERIHKYVKKRMKK